MVEPEPGGSRPRGVAVQYGSRHRSRPGRPQRGFSRSQQDGFTALSHSSYERVASSLPDAIPRQEPTQKGDQFPEDDKGKNEGMVSL